ncbi:unnamed protein product [Brachionus calyciflorus]|uniref:Protein KTI12 homolog n=1 Tax=Brachionus calyciflorus TaxID=104777 RepID=A0A813VPZ2_9BILA|nr:unnamed protein product [Brachionus calyciflorus]
MPFVMMCGLPSSGKTYYANKLAEYLRTTLNKNVLIVNETPFLKDKNSVYLDSGQEKELRANLKSEVQKLMSKEDVVILDYLTYIKGYRYELFCISKLYQTPQCVVSITNSGLSNCSFPKVQQLS